MRVIFYFVLMVIFICSQPFASSLWTGHRQAEWIHLPVKEDKAIPVLSAVEDILLFDNGIRMKSRVDTGAEGSSLHAEEVTVTDEHGQKYAHFYTLDDRGHRYELKEKIHDIVEVTNTSGIPERRYVIEKSVILKGKTIVGKVNLKDRSNMNFKFLIGRDLIKSEGFLVDINS